MYDIYIGKTQLPITPSKIQLKIKNQNKTITLIDEGEINLLKSAGLTDITFTALLPNVDYPFSNGGNARSILNELERLKKRKSFQFIVSRVLPNGRNLFNTNIKVSLEDYKVSDDAKQGFDVSVDVALKQYKSYGTKVITIKPPTTTKPATAKTEPQRPAEKTPSASHGT